MNYFSNSIPNSNRKVRIRCLKFYLNNSGVLNYKKEVMYSPTLRIDNRDLIGQLELGEVIVMRYSHGHVKNKMIAICKKYKGYIEVSFGKSSQNVLFFHRANDSISVEMMRTILKEDLWRLLF